LHHAVLRKDYENVAAILFLIDRYIYWQGGSQTLLDIVDSIMKEKPELPIAPQLVIRKARVMRTSGDLQGLYNIYIIYTNHIHYACLLISKVV
jgi:hypothetical protein